MDEELTPEQQRELESLNDRYGVTEWVIHTDGAASMTLDDGSIAVVQPDGETEVL